MIMTHIYKTKPFEHQRQALIKGAEKEYFLFLMGMGTGKTKVAIDNAVYLYNNKKVDTVLIIVPNSITHNWKKEIEIHSSTQNKTHIYKKDNFDYYEKGKLNWYIMNVEALSHVSGVRVAKKLIDSKKDTMFMAVDECTTIKNHKAKRTKNIIKISLKVKYKRGMTGSPTTKSPLDLYSQCEFLKPGLLGYKSYYAFRARYCAMRPLSNEGNRQIMIPMYFTNLSELEGKIKSFSSRVKKEDCFDLPPKVFSKRLLGMSKEQLECYTSLKKYARAIFQDKEASYTNKLTELLRLHQVTCGFFVSDKGQKESFDTPKMAELCNIIDEAEGKVIIWANYIHNLEQIIQVLKKKYPLDETVAIYGAVNVKDRDQAVEAFQNDSKTRFFVGNPSTGGYGLNLTAATTVIYFSNSYDLTLREQSEDRAHRHGQKNSVAYIDLVTKGTIDEFIIKALNEKKKMSAQTLGEEVLNFL